MKFKSITIENCFSYAGKVEFNFNSTQKTITLIIGENGFGKTSFINSVKIALHGITKDLLNIGAQTLTKHDFILGNSEKHFSGLLNRKAKAKGIDEAKIIITTEDDDAMVIERSFKLHTNQYTEILRLYNIDGELIAEDEEAQDIINSKISPTLAKFFFFDGEKIQQIADFSHNEFTKMLEDVLELDIYDQMVKDSEELIRRLAKNELDSALEKEIFTLEKRLEQIKLTHENTKQKLKEEKRKLKAMEREHKVMESGLFKMRNRYQDSLNASKEKLQTLLEKKDQLTQVLKEITLLQLPLLLNQKLYDSVTEDIDSNYRGRVQIDPELLEKKKKELLAHLSYAKDEVAQAFDAVFQATILNQSVPFANPYHVEKQFDTLKKINFKKLLNDLSHIRKEIEDTKLEISTLEEQMVNDINNYDEAFKASKELLKEIGRKKSLCDSLEEEIRKLHSKEKETKRSLDKLTIKEFNNALVTKKIETLRSVIAVAKEMKAKIKQSKRASLEQTINTKFQLLKKESYEADKIMLDDNFKINIFDKHGMPLDILSSSSGQKQIIATALIWGISEYINEEIPMIIDTPLGRLDDKNQTLILEQFYPQASKQVIILPTPSELKNEGFQKLKNQINEVFILSNRGSATTVTKGHYQVTLPLQESV